MSFENCQSSFSSWSGFLRHLAGHEDREPVSSPSLKVASDFDVDCAKFEFDEFDNYFSQDQEGQPTNRSLLEEFSSLLGYFSSSLLATGVTQSTLDLVLKESKYLQSQLIDLMLSELSHLLGDTFPEIELKFKSILKVFDSFKSSYRRLAYFKGTNRMNVPIEKTLGTRTEVRSRNNKRLQIL